MREHRIVGLILLSLCYMMMSVACSYEPKPPVVAPPPTLPPTTEPEPVTIIWAFWGDPWEVEINERVIAVFEADHPHINVKTVHLPWNAYFKTMREKLAAGEQVADIYFWGEAPNDIAQGYFRDLSDLMAAENYSLDDFFPGLLTRFQVDGGIYGLPRDSDSKVIFYNKRLFDRAGLNYPPSDWTWADLRQIALALKEAEVADYSFAYEVNSWWMIWMWQNEIQVFDHKLKPTKTFIGEAGAAEAIQFLADLTNIDQVTPPYEMMISSQDIAELFMANQLAMAFGNHALVPAFAEIEDLEWDVVGLPQGQKRANLTSGAGYVISAKTPHLEASWTFLKFLAGFKGQAIFAESGLAIPARRTVAQSKVFMDQQPAHNAQIFLDEAEIGEANPAFSGSMAIFDFLNDEALPPVWRGERDAARALQDALPNIEAILADNQ